MKLFKYLFFIILGALVVAGSYFGYKFYIQAKVKSVDALYLIPDNAAIIIGTSSYNSLKKEWDKSKDLALLFEKDQEFSNKLNDLDSTYKTIDKLVADNNQITAIYFSIHFMGRDNFNSMLSFSFQQSLSRDDFEKSIMKIGNFKVREFESSIIYQFNYNNKKEKYFLSLEHNNIFITSYEPILERLILENQSQSQEKKQNIDKMVKVRGKDAPASVYINYKYMYRLISSQSQNDYINIIKQLGNFSQYSVLDFNSQENSISLLGYSFCEDSINNLLSSFNGFDAPKVDIYSHVPDQTILLYYQGADKFNEFIENRSQSAFNTENKLALQSYKADMMIDAEDYFYPWIKSNIAFGLLSNNSGASEGFALANTYDIKEAMQTLGKLKTIASEFKKTEIDTTFYRSYEIHFIPLPYLLSNVFGKIFTPIQQTYYCAIDNYIVFANSSETMKRYIDNILINKTLSNREDFSEFQSKLSSQAHIVLYANIHYFNILSKQFLAPTTISYLQSSSMNLQEIGDFAIEFIEDKNGAYTTMNISKTNWEEDGDKVSWQVALDYPIAKGPFLFENHQTNKIDVIVFDNHNQMYRINHLGEIVWAIPVAELPIGGISIVDFYKNDKHQFIYNSENYLYLFDLNGNKVENYPIALSQRATAPLTLVDYDKRNDYRIIIPMADGKIHNYKIEGIETSGWENPVMPELVNTEVQYFRLGSKDFLILADTAGNVLFSNRRGEARIEARLAFTNNINTKFYKLDNKLITTDRMGRIIVIDANGQVEKKLLGDFSDKHYFNIIDVDQDGRDDFLYIDRNAIFAYNQNGDTIWTKKLEENIYPKVESLHENLIDSCNNLVYNIENNVFALINKEGEFINKEEYSASNNFIIYETTKDKKTRLITSKNRVISNYLLK